MLEALIKVVILVNALPVAVMFLVLLERRMAAWIQDRIGPNRAGPKGLFQPLADGLKNLLKEEVIPGGSNKVFFVVAPAISLMAALMIPLTIPWAAPIPLGAGCVRCHTKFTTEAVKLPLLAGLVVAIPVKDK